MAGFFIVSGRMGTRQKLRLTYKTFAGCFFPKQYVGYYNQPWY